MRLPRAVADRVARAERYGFTADGPPAAAFTAKPGSHDDGPGHGMFLGGLGAPAFSRDLDGRFSRWHLEPGAHVLADIEQCQLRVRWTDARGPQARALRRETVDGYRTYGLFPMWHERFTAADMPFSVLLTGLSPVLPGEPELAALPVVCFDVWLEPHGDGALPAVDVALFWANLCGWRASSVSTADRGDRAWPGQHHAGNCNRAGEPGCTVLQGREPGLRGPDGTAGEVAVSVSAAADCSRRVQFKTDQNATGVPAHRQPDTFAAVCHAFDTTGRLDTAGDDGWVAHWHEPIGSAVAAHHPGGADPVRTRFVLAFDWPLVVFGSGRAWWRPHARVGLGAAALAARAHRDADDWLAALDAWHTATLDGLTAAGWPDKVAGCVVNETGLVTGLGSMWLAGAAPGSEPSGVLRGGEHFGLLEGFDTGYFYVNTSDLWLYAFPALTRAWPHLADLVFADLGDGLDGADPTRRPVYRAGQRRALLVAGRLPHDMGAVPEDPFVALNGYTMRDDPNTWRDANPGFVLGTVLHHRMLRRPLPTPVWQRLRAAAAVVAADAADGAVPRHDEFGDSTWDNLGLRGWSAYASALCAGMWAVLDAESRARGEDNGDHTRLRAARDVLDRLWDGDHYRACSQGRYIGAVMPDALLGLFYAGLAGGTPVVDRARIATHLATAYRIAHRGYRDGAVGPLLVAEPGAPRYARDGGEELQVNEVLLGPAWMFAAMLHHYGLRAEATEVAGTLRTVLYGGTGLQYRSPAAVDGDGRFRAPLNMRPLAAWWLAVVSDPDFASGWTAHTTEGSRSP